MCRSEILPAGCQQRKTNIKAFNPCLRGRPEGAAPAAVAVPRVSVLVSDLLLHLGIRERFQQGAPLVSVACVADRDLHGRQRVLAAG